MVAFKSCAPRLHHQSLLHCCLVSVPPPPHHLICLIPPYNSLIGMYDTVSALLISV
jgi:hypothetical protein